MADVRNVELDAGYSEKVTPLLPGLGYFACKQNTSSSNEGANMLCIAFVTYYSCHGSPSLQSLYLFPFPISLHPGFSLALPEPQPC